MLAVSHHGGDHPGARAKQTRPWDYAAPPMATMLPRYCRGDGFKRYGAKFQRRRQI
jgi:hypothetical protein